MKLERLLALGFVLTIGTTDLEAQLLKRLQKRVENKIERTVERELNEKIDETFEGKKKKPKSSSENSSNTSSKDRSSNTNQNNSDQEYKQQPKESDSPKSASKNTSIANSPKKALDVYRNFKYIPGEDVIFYDDLKLEETGEFPSRWDLLDGGAEISTFNGEKVIMPTTKYNNIITPLFETDNYLGDEFTVEFDVYLDDIKGTNDWTQVNVSFHTKGNQNKETREDIRFNFRTAKTQGYVWDKNSKSFNFEEVRIKDLQAWHHVSISYYKGKLKVYFNEHRIANLPNFKQEIKDFAINLEQPVSEDKKEFKTAIKNIRIAHGGGKMYKRIMSDGKYVTNGILFDSGKAVIKPQSMGIINKIVNVMQEQPDWHFKIIGHTDSDGNDTTNLKLSKDRAAAVKQAIVNAGIDASRLSIDGKGESQPLNTNASNEEKANNRRVEFIKQ